MSRPWMPLYVADYLKDTGHLTAAEHGAYLLLIMHYWANGGLPSDDRQVGRISRMTEREWKNSKATIAEFFEEGWKHGRIDAELAEAADKSESARASARKRWDKKRHANASANAMQTHMRSICLSPSQSETRNLPAQQPTPPAAALKTREDWEKLEARLLEAAGISREKQRIAHSDLSEIVGLIKAGYSLEDDILPALRLKGKAGKIGGSWGYYVEAIRDFRSRRVGAAAVKAQPEGERRIPIGTSYPMPESNLKRAVEAWKANPASWAPQWGDPPDENSDIQRWLRESQEPTH